MSEKQAQSKLSHLSETEQQRFENNLLQWLSGHLSPDETQWMQQVQQRHAQLANEVAWLADFRAMVRQGAKEENTDAAWSNLQNRIVLPSKHGAHAENIPDKWLLRWLQWLVGHSGLAHTAAVLVVTVVLGQAIWIFSTNQEAQAPEWRSFGIENLQVAEPQAIRVQIQLQEGSLSADMAALANTIGSAEVIWQTQPDGTWILTISQAATDPSALLTLLQTQPGVAQVRLLP